jgi:hypothetical protein
MMEAIVARSGAQAASGRRWPGGTNRSATVAVAPENITSISGEPLR